MMLLNKRENLHYSILSQELLLPREIFSLYHQKKVTIRKKMVQIEHLL